jgi:hypothetical protein
LTEKLVWRGRLTSVQPRIRLLRSFDQRSHSYLGFVLRVKGVISNRQGEFTVAVGKAAHAKHQFRVGDLVTGSSHFVANPKTESAEWYKTTGVSMIARGPSESETPPPWHGVPPESEVYRQRGHRRLDARTYESNCADTAFGVVEWRLKSSSTTGIDKTDAIGLRHFAMVPNHVIYHKAGPTRKVPGRRGMIWEEEDWVDIEATSHRGLDD